MFARLAFLERFSKLKLYAKKNRCTHAQMSKTTTDEFEECRYSLDCLWNELSLLLGTVASNAIIQYCYQLNPSENETWENGYIPKDDPRHLTLEQLHIVFTKHFAPFLKNSRIKLMDMQGEEYDEDFLTRIANLFSIPLSALTNIHLATYFSTYYKPDYAWPLPFPFGQVDNACCAHFASSYLTFWKEAEILYSEGTVLEVLEVLAKWTFLVLRNSQGNARFLLCGLFWSSAFQRTCHLWDVCRTNQVEGMFYRLLIYDYNYDDRHLPSVWLQSLESWAVDWKEQITPLNRKYHRLCGDILSLEDYRTARQHSAITSVDKDPTWLPAIREDHTERKIQKWLRLCDLYPTRFQILRKKLCDFGMLKRFAEIDNLGAVERRTHDLVSKTSFWSCASFSMLVK